ncbi:hypothetical protein FJY63_01435, partial [Candidatus Sumerlaeota bacterium]|nr:hypothetical protein [Candidatus Sumerlaeota bacterium]
RAPEGDETWVPPVPTPPAALAPTPRLLLKPEAAAEKPAVKRTALRRRRWLWLAAAAPGLLALAIVVFAVVLPWKRNRAIERQLVRSSFEQGLSFLRDLDMTRSVGEMYGLVQKYEGLLRDKAIKAVEEQTKSGVLLSRTRRDVQRNAEQVIYPYLTDEQREQWIADLRGLESESARPRDNFDRLKSFPLESLFNEPAQRPEPDPQRARQAFQRALDDARDFKGTGKSQLRHPLIYRCARRFQESVAYDPNNWQYHLEFARFLAQRASESDAQPRLHGKLRQEAIKMAERASDLCPDAEKGKIKEFVEQLRTAAAPHEATSFLLPNRRQAFAVERDRS